jgi:hypothetical protein
MLLHRSPEQEETMELDRTAGATIIGIVVSFTLLFVVGALLALAH